MSSVRRDGGDHPTDDTSLFGEILLYFRICLNFGQHLESLEFLKSVVFFRGPLKMMVVPLVFLLNQQTRGILKKHTQVVSRVAPPVACTTVHR